MFYSYVFNTFLPKMTNFLRFFHKNHRIHLSSASATASVHAVTEIASYKHGETHVSFSHPHMPLIRKRHCVRRMRLLR